MNPYHQYLAILFTSLAVSIGIQLVLPWPYGLAVSLGLFIIFPLIYKRIIISKNLGLGRFGGMEGAKFGMKCTVCGKKTRERNCPRCGGNSFGLA